MVRPKISVEFPDLCQEVIVELDEGSAPATVKAILERLPLEVMINRWGDELYTEPMPVKVGIENAKTVVDLMDAAYWPQGNALCLFFGPTPISTGNKIKPYSSVNVVGRIISKGNVAKRVNDSTRVIIRSRLHSG
ncbi:MAG: cyclophilin-like fold protein [Nitrososphaerales archaeon]